MLDKQIFVRASVLEISKWLMYDFHYGFTKRVWLRSNLLFTDTDSLVDEIFADDVFKDTYDHRDQFDLSEVASDNLFHDRTNKKVMGLMKDEFCFNVVTEFIGLRSKMYLLKTASGKETKKLKGVKKSVVKINITYDDYLVVLFSKQGHDAEMTTIKSYKNTIKTDKVIKQGLTNFDDKHYCVDGIKTLALGHYKTRNSISLTSE